MNYTPENSTPDDSMFGLAALIAESPAETIAESPARPVTPARLVPTMSSLQIAEITGKPHGNVMSDIRRILDEAEIGQQEFLLARLDAQGKERPYYLLPRRECDLVISGYSVKYRLAIIDRWQLLEAQVAAPARDPMEILKDPAAMRGLLLTYSEKVMTLEASVTELTPKAAALDRLAGADGSMCVSTAAKSLNVRPRDLFAWLSCHEWIFRRGADWLGYQARLSKGLLEHKVTTVSRTDGSEKVCTQVLVTSKGLAALALALGVEVES
jgi:phage antirepressor YoqD-like protein/phage regulator Rha-like protein